MTVKVINIQPPSTSKINPLNPLSKNVRIHLHKCLEEAYADPKVTSIVLFGGANFSAGADITEFSAKGKDPKNEIEGSKEIPSLEELTRLIENSSKQVVAAVTGVALGGGCEIALSCHFRVAHAKARMGLPETKIGLIPGTYHFTSTIDLCAMYPQYLSLKSITYHDVNKRCRWYTTSPSS